MSDDPSNHTEHASELSHLESLRPSKRIRSRLITVAAATVGHRTPASRGLKFHMTPYAEPSRAADRQDTSKATKDQQANLPHVVTPVAPVPGPGPVGSPVPLS